ncbi:unnamed protein product [Allacma fusca]|uniref:Uncharacterized protein n=1 Tax=Allacma fusca TaxID=39272 RepID=A0A8J2LJ54_9HEXA|nr:unnamed protein product [Allacma fusca]
MFLCLEPETTAGFTLDIFEYELIYPTVFPDTDQGGILSSLLDLYTQLVPIRFNSTQVDIIFSQMSAIPPIFVLAIPAKWKTLVTAPTAMAEEELGIPSTLYKTVLKLDMNSKIRVFHTGLTPLPKSHLERDISRIIQGQHHPTGETVEKTYWNHVCLSLWNEDVQKRPLVDVGLNLYRVEVQQYWKRKAGANNVTERDQKFQKIFKFHDFLSELMYYAVNAFSMIFTTVLFFMSYLVFLT